MLIQGSPCDIQLPLDVPTLERLVFTNERRKVISELYSNQSSKFMFNHCSCLSICATISSYNARYLTSFFFFIEEYCFLTALCITQQLESSENLSSSEKKDLNEELETCTKRLTTLRATNLVRILESRKLLNDFSDILKVGMGASSDTMNTVFVDILNRACSETLQLQDTQSPMDDKAAAQATIPTHTSLPAYTNSSLAAVEHILRQSPIVVFTNSSPATSGDVSPGVRSGALSLSGDTLPHLTSDALPYVLSLCSSGAIDLYNKDNYKLLTWVMRQLPSSHPLAVVLIAADLMLHDRYYNNSDYEARQKDKYLREASYIHFGDRPCHQSLTPAQLRALAKLVPKLWLSRAFVCQLVLSCLDDKFSLTDVPESPYNPAFLTPGADASLPTVPNPSAPLYVSSPASLALAHPTVLANTAALDKALAVAVEAHEHQLVYIRSRIRGDMKVPDMTTGVTVAENPEEARPTPSKGLFDRLFKAGVQIEAPATILRGGVLVGAEADVYNAVAADSVALDAAHSSFTPVSVDDVADTVLVGGMGGSASALPATADGSIGAGAVTDGANYTWLACGFTHPCADAPVAIKPLLKLPSWLPSISSTWPARHMPPSVASRSAP